MAKFYVQSGTLRSVVQAESSKRAALWAVHQAMQQVLPMEDADGITPQDKNDAIAENGMAVMSRTVTVSERGFDRADAAKLPTLEVVNEWNDLVMTLDRLERMLHMAG
jgi:fibronectin type 3 domain-containing protein